MTSNLIITETKDRVVFITLNRPNALNALSYELVSQLENKVRYYGKNKDICAIVIRGSGRAFCAGADLTELLRYQNDPNKLSAYIDQINKAFNSLEDCPVPIIAAVHGYVLAGGFELIQACDITIATENAILGDQHVNYGLIPGGGGSQRLRYLVGLQKAKEILLTGRWINGIEAEKDGLIARAVPEIDFDSYIEEVLENLRSKHPETLRYIKELMTEPWKDQIRSHLKFEKNIFLKYLKTTTAKNGLIAFKKRRIKVDYEEDKSE